MNPVRVLIVDDAATVRLYHRKLLGDAGWTTEEAVNGVEALEKASAAPAGQPFDLFVVDVNMPKLDGYGFIRALRQAPLASAAPVLMVSTEAQLQDASAALDAGANCYLVKPARPAELVLTAALLVGDWDAASKAAQAQLPRGAAS